MPIYLDADRLQPGERTTQLVLGACEPAPPETDIAERDAHRVRVVEVTDRDGSEFFVVCSCGYVSLPSVWRPQRVAPVVCEMAELLRRSARNRRILARALVAVGETV